MCDGERGLGASEIFTCSPWQKGRVEQKDRNHQGGRRAKRFCKHQVAGRSAYVQLSAVSYEVVHVLNQRAGRLGISPATRVFGQRMKVYGRTDGTRRGRVLIRRWWMKETSWQDVSSYGGPARELWTRSQPMKTFEPGTLVSFADTTQANERKRQCEDDIWDPQL